MFLRGLINQTVTWETRQLVLLTLALIHSWTNNIKRLLPI